MKTLLLLNVAIPMTVVFSLNLYTEEWEIFLREINRIRRKVDPPASRMMEVMWSEELATIASTYASECIANVNALRNNQSNQVKEVGELHYVAVLNKAISSFLVDAVASWNDPAPVNDTIFIVPCQKQDYLQVYITIIKYILACVHNTYK
jgi:hypothetical protein